jgi:hypothetical protein
MEFLPIHVKALKDLEDDPIALLQKILKYAADFLSLPGKG